MMYGLYKSSFKYCPLSSLRLFRSTSVNMSGKQFSVPCLPYGCVTTRLLLLLLQIMLLFFSLTSIQVVGIVAEVLWLVVFGGGAGCECFLVITILPE